MTPREGWGGIRDMAAHLQVSKESVYRWVETQGFPTHRVGRLLQFKLSEVDEWVTSNGEAKGSLIPTEATVTEEPTRQRSGKKMQGGI
jgi:excisionase family DNA binding protein